MTMKTATPKLKLKMEQVQLPPLVNGKRGGGREGRRRSLELKAGRRVEVEVVTRIEQRKKGWTKTQKEERNLP